MVDGNEILRRMEEQHTQEVELLTYARRNCMRKVSLGPTHEALFVHPLYGARTIANCVYMDSVLAKAVPQPKFPKPVTCSLEMELRNERCIDEHGVGMF